MKTFDIEKFNQHRDTMNIGVADYTLDDGSHIHAVKSGPEYHIVKATAGSPYSARYSYYPNFAIKSVSNSFHDLLYGTSYQYDTEGKVVKETDEDKPFKYSLKEFISEMLKEYKIDLMDPKAGIRLRRYINDQSKLPEYELRMPLTSDRNKIRRLIINGNNGHLISDTIVGPPRDD